MGWRARRRTPWFLVAAEQRVVEHLLLLIGRDVPQGLPPAEGGVSRALGQLPCVQQQVARSWSTSRRLDRFVLPRSLTPGEPGESGWNTRHHITSRHIPSDPQFKLDTHLTRFTVETCRGLTFTWWGYCDLRQRHKPTELAHSFSLGSCVCFCFYVPFNCISFHNSPDNSPLSHSVLPFLFLPYCPSNYISFYESLLQRWYDPLWLTGLLAPANNLTFEDDWTKKKNQTTEPMCQKCSFLCTRSL